MGRRGVFPKRVGMGVIWPWLDSVEVLQMELNGHLAQSCALPAHSPGCPLICYENVPGLLTALSVSISSIIRTMSETLIRAWRNIAKKKRKKREERKAASRRAKVGRETVCEEENKPLKP